MKGGRAKAWTAALAACGMALALAPAARGETNRPPSTLLTNYWVSAWEGSVSNAIVPRASVTNGAFSMWIVATNGAWMTLTNNANTADLYWEWDGDRAVKPRGRKAGP
jgi:hypothetical protein